MDHVGNIIGRGDSACMMNEPNPNLWTKCENQDGVCATHMYIDWLVRGGHAVIVDRRCISKDLAPSNLESLECLEEIAPHSVLDQAVTRILVTSSINTMLEMTVLPVSHVNMESTTVATSYQTAMLIVSCHPLVVQ